MADEQEIEIKVDLRIIGTLTIVKVPSLPPIPGPVASIALTIDSPGPRQF